MNQHKYARYFSTTLVLGLFCGLTFSPVQAEQFNYSKALAQTFISTDGGSEFDIDETDIAGLTAVALENSRPSVEADASAVTEIFSNKARTNAQLSADEPDGVNVSALGQATSWWRDTATIFGPSDTEGIMVVHLEGTLFASGDNGSGIIDFKLIWDALDDTSAGEQIARYTNNFNSESGLFAVDEVVTLNFDFEIGVPTAFDGYLQVTSSYGDTLGLSTTDFFGTATLIGIVLPLGYTLTVESGSELPLGAPVPLPSAFVLFALAVVGLMKSSTLKI